MTLSIADVLGSGDGTSTWSWKENFVQLDENMATPGLFIAAESTLIAFGPAKATAAFDVVRIGLTPNIAISQQIPQQRLPEIGSMRVHILNGTPVGGGSMSRLVYNGPSLMRSCYGNIYDDNGDLTSIGITGMMTDSGTAQTYVAHAWSNITANPDKVMKADSSTNLWMSCWDIRLRSPFGICIYMQDIANHAVGGIYAEGVKINSHNFNQAAGQLIMVEGISFAFDRLVPVKGTGTSSS